jgi:ADP-ribosyl-[dinitrogen reductase] hydrolase
MLVELAIGDAYGAGFEYVNGQLISQFNDLQRYYKHPTHSINPGRYTDDTQMSIAIAEAIVSGEPWTRELLADKFVEAFKRDPREGYAGRFYQFLLNVQSGAQFLAEIIPESDKSGAAMRAAPIGIFPTIDEVVARSTLQARLTHDTPDGICAAVASALMSHYCLYNLGPLKALPDFLETHAPGKQWSEPWRGKVRSKGWMSVMAALTALINHQSLSALLKACIEYSGDVDTVATIALAAASCSKVYDQDLPEVLLDGLENGPYGRDYLQQLNEQLLALVKTQ